MAQQAYFAPINSKDLLKLLKKKNGSIFQNLWKMTIEIYYAK